MTIETYEDIEKLKTKLTELVEVNKDLASKIQYLVDSYVNCPEGYFTFPDGDTYYVKGNE